MCRTVHVLCNFLIYSRNSKGPRTEPHETPWVIKSFSEVNSLMFQKQPSRSVLRKRCSENMQQIYGRTPLLKCDFNKVALQELLLMFVYWYLSLRKDLNQLLVISLTP